MKGLPGQFEAFLGDNASKGQVAMADNLSYVVIFLVLALLAWMIWDIHKTNKKLQAKFEAAREE